MTAGSDLPATPGSGGGSATAGEGTARAAADSLRERIGCRPRLHVVLGSGLGSVADGVEDPVAVPFTELPGFPQPTVEGHAGRFVAGRVAGVPTLVQQGRFHYYEGWDSEVVGLPVRTGHALGARALVLTNAAGGIRRDLEPGSLMLIDDHLHLGFRSPLAGPVRRGEARFPDMSRPYDPEFMALAESAATETGTRLVRGVYAMVLGPSFETPAEVRALRAAGADAVGMSTAPEAVVARALGQRVLGISMISNWAAGLAEGTLDHEDVMAWADSAGRALAPLLEAALPKMADLQAWDSGPATTPADPRPGAAARQAHLT